MCGQARNHGAGAELGADSLAAQISLKGDGSLLKLPESILPNIKSKLSTGILMPISDRR